MADNENHDRIMQKLKYELGDRVYLITDPEQHERMVTAITLRGTGAIYGLGLGAEESWHYDYEITDEKDELKKVMTY